MTKATCLLASVLTLTGCGSTTGIVPVAPGTFALSEMRAPVLGGGAEARRVVLAEAAEFCRRHGRVASPLTLRPDGDPYTPYFPTAFDITFRCLAPGDPAGAAPGTARPAERPPTP